MNSWRVGDKTLAFCKMLFLSLITLLRKKHLFLLITIFFSFPYSLYVFWKYLGLCYCIFLIFFIEVNKTYQKTNQNWTMEHSETKKEKKPQPHHFFFLPQITIYNSSRFLKTSYWNYALIWEIGNQVSPPTSSLGRLT